MAQGRARQTRLALVGICAGFATLTARAEAGRTQPAVAPPQAQIAAPTAAEMGSPAQRDRLLRQLRRNCERFSTNPRLLGDRIKVCRCLHDSHEKRTRLKDLRELVRIYRESNRTEQISRGSGDPDVDLLISYDIEIASECLTRLAAGDLKSSP